MTIAGLSREGTHRLLDAAFGGDAPVSNCDAMLPNWHVD
jgi:hypothetical protein